MLPLIDHKKIPITVIQGFLGSGKTTLLNHILSNNQGMNIGVVVNDFGDINIDSLLVKSKTDKRLELTSGCICCSLETLDLQEAINQFTYKDSKIDYIIIEASGLAEPRDLAMTLKQTLGQKVRLDSIVTVLDAENIEKNASQHDTARDQIIFTDFIVINKLDLVKKSKIAEIQTMIASFNPKARILESIKAQVDVRLLLDQDMYKLKTFQAKLDNHTKKTTTAADQDPSDLHDDHSSHVHSHYTSFSWSSKKPLDPKKFQEFVNRLLPTQVYRAKGFVDFGIKGHVRKYIFQLVGVRPEIVWENWHSDTPQTQLVFIGQGIDKGQIKADLQACIDPEPSQPLDEGIELKLPEKADL